MMFFTLNFKYQNIREKYKYSVKQCAYPRNLTTRDIIGAITGTLKSKVVKNYEKHHLLHDQAQNEIDHQQLEDVKLPEYQEKEEEDNINNQMISPEKIQLFQSEEVNRKIQFDKKYLDEANRKLPEKIIYHPEHKKEELTIWDKDNKFIRRQSSNFNNDYQINHHESNTQSLQTISRRRGQSALKKQLDDDYKKDMEEYNFHKLNKSVNYSNHKKQNDLDINKISYLQKKEEEFKNYESTNMYRDKSQEEIQQLIRQYEKDFTASKVNKSQAKNYDILNFNHKEDWRNSKNPYYSKILNIPQSNVFCFMENVASNYQDRNRIPSRHERKYLHQSFSKQKPNPYLEEELINNHLTNEYNKLPFINNTQKPSTAYDPQSLYKQNYSMCVNTESDQKNDHRSNNNLNNHNYENRSQLVDSENHKRDYLYSSGNKRSASVNQQVQKNEVDHRYNRNTGDNKSKDIFKSFYDNNSRTLDKYPERSFVEYK